jgi:hypothetical protein
MVSITHADIDELTEDEVRIPAGGRWMEMDWECVHRHGLHVRRSSTGR